MFRRKKKDEPTDAPPTPEVAPEAASETAVAEPAAVETPVAESVSAETSAPSTDAAGNGAESAAAASAKPAKSARGNRVQKIGTVASDKMQKTVVVRVDRKVLHPKYRRYVRRTSKFMAHDDLGATVGDRVRIVETRPMSAKKRWRVIEIVQKAAK
ncbi:MAG: 30S ribosomal protein S17 [Pyrinomonadaceae bacterium]